MTDHRLAPAKINLGLEVLGKRDDGYHEIATVMQMVTLDDTVMVAPAEDAQLPPGFERITDRQDLVARAASSISEKTGQPEREMAVRKEIPIAAGLGGGSSDAASTLMLLNSLDGNPLDQQALHTLASSLGADVPFFLNGPAALATGRGDHLAPLASLPACTIVLITPQLPIADKTKQLYQWLGTDDFSDGDRVATVANSIGAGHLPPPESLGNTFWRPLIEAAPWVAEVEQRTIEAGAPFVALSGSGPTLYTWFTAVPDADEFVKLLPSDVRDTCQCIITAPILTVPRLAPRQHGAQ